MHHQYDLIQFYLFSLQLRVVISWRCVGDVPCAKNGSNIQQNIKREMHKWINMWVISVILQVNRLIKKICVKFWYINDKATLNDCIIVMTTHFVSLFSAIPHFPRAHYFLQLTTHPCLGPDLWSLQLHGDAFWQSWHETVLSLVKK